MQPSGHTRFYTTLTDATLIRTTSVALPNYDATNYPAIGRTISLTLSKAW
jgi:hypothetical protein